MTPPTDWKRSILAPVLALAMLGSLVALPAIAAPSTKKIYTASFDNTGAPAGTQVVRDPHAYELEHLVGHPILRLGSRQDPDWLHGCQRNPLRRQPARPGRRPS